MTLNEIDHVIFVLSAKTHGLLMRPQFPSLILVIYVVNVSLNLLVFETMI